MTGHSGVLARGYGSHALGTSVSHRNQYQRLHGTTDLSMIGTLLVFLLSAMFMGIV